jgi:lipoate-protein ligase B
LATGIWHALGLVSYAAGLEVQERIAGERERDLRPDTLLLLEHPPTITLGRRASRNDVLWNPEALARAGIAVERVRRGGQATYHGPGQLVGYPIVRLSSAGRGVRRFVESLEEMLFDVIASFGGRAERRAGHPGAWVANRKIASIGIEIRRGVSRHGFALNVDMDLGPFSAIIPCGMPGLELTDLARAGNVEVDVSAAAAAVVRAWKRRFGEFEEERLDVVEAPG